MSAYLPGRPTQRSLDLLFSKSSSITIVACAGGIEDLLVYTAQTSDFCELKTALRISERDVGHKYCCERTDIRFSFIDVADCFAKASYHHQGMLYCSGWNSDARLLEPFALAEFLSDRGISYLLRNLKNLKEQRERSLSDREIWLSTAPDAVRHHLREMEENPRRLFKKLKAAYSSEEEICCVLLKWYGTNDPPVGIERDYEALPAKIIEGCIDEPVWQKVRSTVHDDAALKNGIAKYLKWKRLL